MNFKKIFYIIIFSIVFGIAIIGSSHGETKSINVFVGNTKITVEVPPDFGVVKRNTSPELWQIAESWTAQSKELLALMVEGDAVDSQTKIGPALKKYLLVQVAKQFKNTKLSDSDFDQFKKDFKENEKKIEAKAKAKEAEEEDEEGDKEASIKKPIDPLTEFTRSTLSKPNSFPLGVFHETDSSIGTVDLLKQIVVVEDEKVPHLTAVATNILFLKGKMFYLYVLQEYESPTDSEWVEIMSEHWVNTTIELNQDKKKAKPKAGLTKAKKVDKKNLTQKKVGDIKIHFKNGRSLVCEKAWRDGDTVYVIVGGKEYAVGYSVSEIDMEKSVGIN